MRTIPAESHRFFSKIQEHCQSLGHEVTILKIDPNEYLIVMAEIGIILPVYFFLSGDESMSTIGIGLLESSVSDPVVLSFIANALQISPQLLTTYLQQELLPDGIMGASCPVSIIHN